MQLPYECVFQSLWRANSNFLLIELVVQSLYQSVNELISLALLGIDQLALILWQSLDSTALSLQ